MQPNIFNPAQFAAVAGRTLLIPQGLLVLDNPRRKFSFGFNDVRQSVKGRWRRLKQQLTNALSSHQCETVRMREQTAEGPMTFRHRLFALLHLDKAARLIAATQTVRHTLNAAFDLCLVFSEAPIVVFEEVLRAPAKRLRFLKFDEAPCIQKNLDGPKIRSLIRHRRWRPFAPLPFRRAS